MPRLSRNLLLIAALCWVAPASAEFASTGAEEDCPHSRGARQVIILDEAAIGGIPVAAGRRALLP